MSGHKNGYSLEYNCLVLNSGVIVQRERRKSENRCLTSVIESQFAKSQQHFPLSTGLMTTLRLVLRKWSVKVQKGQQHKGWMANLCCMFPSQAKD